MAQATLASDQHAVLGAATLAAARCGAPAVGAAHLLLEILRDRADAPARLALSLGAPVEEVDAALQARGIAVAPEAAEDDPRAIGLSPDLHDTLRRAQDEVARLRHPQVSAEAVLRASACHPTLVAGQALRDVGITDEAIARQAAVPVIGHSGLPST